MPPRGQNPAGAIIIYEAQKAETVLSAVSYIIIYVYIYLLHVTREFHSVNLICRNLYAIFSREKSLYSQSEWRIAVFTCGRITNQR